MELDLSPTVPQSSKRRRRARAGSLDDQCAQEALARGPMTAEELYDWPSRAFNIVEKSGPKAATALANSLKAGVQFITWYSGKGTGESVMTFCEDAIVEGLGMGVQDLRSFQSCSACDVDHDCREVLGLHPDRCRPKHIFGDILHRIPLQDPDLSTLPNEEVRKFLVQNGAKLFTPESTSFCYVHGQACALWDGLDHPGQNTHHERTAFIGSMVGFTCVDWSPRSMTAAPGLQGKHAPVMHHWLQEVRQLEPDFLIYEQSDNFPPEIVDQELGDIYRHDHAVISPDDLGWPVRRNRLFGALTHRRSVIFTGDMERFLQLFRCRVEGDGDWMLQAKQEEVDSWKVNKAASRGYPNVRPEKISLDMLITPAYLDKMTGYRNLRDSRQGMAGTFIADLDQAPGYASCGPCIPVLPTHNTLYSFSGERFFTAGECFAAMGASAASGSWLGSSQKVLGLL